MLPICRILVHWWGCWKLSFLLVQVFLGIAELSAVSFTESLPFPGGAALRINVVLEAK